MAYDICYSPSSSWSSAKTKASEDTLIMNEMSSRSCESKYFSKP